MLSKSISENFDRHAGPALLIGIGLLCTVFTAIVAPNSTSGLAVAALAAITAYFGWQAVKRQHVQKLQLDAALNSMLHGLVLFDASERIVFCNQRYVELSELPPDFIRPGLTLCQLLHTRQKQGSFSRDIEDYRRELLYDIASGQSKSLIITTRDGRVQSVINVPMKGGGWVATHEDITEKVLAERLNVRQKQQLDTALANMSQGLCMFDADQRLIVSNKRFADLYGLSAEQIKPGTTLRQLFESRDHHGNRPFETDRPIELRIQDIQQKNSYHLIDRLPNGGYVSIVHRAMPDGGWVATHENVTEKVVAEQLNAGQKQQLDSALANMSQGLCMFDADYRLIVSNKQYDDLYGLSEDQTRPGTTLRQVLEHRVANGNLAADCQRFVEERITKVSKNESFQVIETWPNGRHVSISHRPMPGGGWVSTHEDVTEKVQAEDLNARQKQQLDSALENMSQGLCMFDAGQRLIICNNQYADLYELSEDLTKPGTSLRRILEHRVDTGSLSDRQPENIEERIRKLSGTEPHQFVEQWPNGRYVSIVHRLMPDGGWLATHEDITEAKRREDSFRLLFEGNPAPMWVVDRETMRFLAVNDAAVKHYGYSREQFTAMSLLDIRPPDHREGFKAILRSLPNHHPHQRPVRHQKADGTMIEVIIASRALTYDGRLARLAVMHDITKVKLAEAELNRTKNFLDTVIEHVPLPILVKDIPNSQDGMLTSRITLVNRAYEELMGTQRAEIIGKTVTELFTPERAELISATDRDTLASTTPLATIEHPISFTTKGVRIVTARKTVIRDENGSPRHLLSVLDDVTERRHSEQRIAHMAHHDSLTDLPNRAAFNEFIAQTLEAAQANGPPFTVLSVDLDRFKEANDSFGHSFGDLLLRAVAQRLRSAAEGTFLARVGGDEFIFVVTHGPQPKAAQDIGERLLAAFSHEFEIEGQRLKLGISIGGATYPTHGADLKSLLANADAALYLAKSQMRGTVQFFEAELGTRLRERRKLQNDLSTALVRDQFILHYQPQRKMSGEVLGFEALVRWQCPSRGLVGPAAFIPAAEESSLIVPLGEWILHEACREAASWPKPLRLAVNISPVQFRSGRLPNLVHSILLNTGLEPSRLELEITENVLIDDFSRAVSILNKLKSLGVQIAMDDFGSGYSSLSYLHSFPFDKIKIDRTFVNDLEHNHHSMAIVRAVIGLGRSLRIPTLAEGVETQAQHALLMSAGCKEVQGYLTGRPLPVASYSEMVGRGGDQPLQHKAVAG
jgi:diguanylate cyclase (GGDEF)-like protein/PAS domain S-box-containing protein